MSNFFKNSEKITKDNVEKTLKKFNRARLDLMKTDELNVPQVTEVIGKLYDNLLEETKKGLQEIKDSVEVAENKPSTLTVEEYLDDYNPLLMYVPLNETVRKRERYIENILALTLAIGKFGSPEGLNTADMLSTQKKAVRLWNTQMTEAFADFERETHKSCWENDGVEYVRWIAQDGACGYCDELNGQVFVLGDEPPLQHINCRCELEPVEINEKDDIIESENTNGQIIPMTEKYIAYDIDAVRNQEPLTEEQIAQAKRSARKQGYTGSISYSQFSSTAIHHSVEGDYYDYLVIGNDAFPRIGSTRANEMLSVDACMAHEIIGHLETVKKGTAIDDNTVLDEVQASIRGSKFGVDLSDADRNLLFQDAMDRLDSARIDFESVKHSLDIWER